MVIYLGPSCSQHDLVSCFLFMYYPIEGYVLLCHLTFWFPDGNTIS